MGDCQRSLGDSIGHQSIKPRLIATQDEIQNGTTGLSSIRRVDYASGMALERKTLRAAAAKDQGSKRLIPPSPNYKIVDSG